MSDEILFLDETEINTSEKNKKDNWKVLIVDDEQEIHLVTTHVLKDFSFKSKGIDFLHAYSGEEAKEVLSKNRDIALIFLDVVMETDDAGLMLVTWIREVLENRFVRIVLRTGQPGLAPEKKIILEYDIDDYRAKTELTAVRLFTTTVASLRAFTILEEQDENRKVLEELVKASWNMGSAKNAEAFLSSVRHQFSTFMSLGDNSFFAKVEGEDGERKLIITMGSGRFQTLGGDVYQDLTLHEKEMVEEALKDGHHVFEDQIIVGVALHNDPQNCRILFIESHEKLKSLDISVVKIFLSSLDSAYENLVLSHEVAEAHLTQINMQKVLLDRLNNVLSIRSKETAGHVRRVAESSALLAEKFGCSNEYIELLKTASPMHDIGKVGVPDSILLKPGPLTDSERLIIETHAIIGKGMFDGDNSPLINMAREIAGSHHERWDGLGYPDKLSGEEIPLSGRITAICDVFDALLSIRPYKAAYPIERVMDIMTKDMGKSFDPMLLEIFIRDIDEMMNIFNKYEE